MGSEQLPSTVEVDGVEHEIKFNTGNEDFDYEITAPDFPDCLAVNEDLDVALGQIRDAIRTCRASAEKRG